MKEAFEKIRKKVRVLSEQEFCKRRKQEECDKYVDCETCLIDSVIQIVSEVEAEYKDKFTSVCTYEQVAWERNVAIAQLKELGYGLGEKIRKVEAECGNGREKQTYEICLNGCDDDTIFKMELTENEYKFLLRVSELANKTSTCGCMPRLYVKKHTPTTD